MFLRTSGKSAETSLPKVIDMMVFWIASFLDCRQDAFSFSLRHFVPFVGILRPMHKCKRRSDSQSQRTYTKPALSSNVSPFLGAAKALFSLLTAIFAYASKAATPVAPLPGSSKSQWTVDAATTRQFSESLSSVDAGISYQVQRTSSTVFWV